MKIVSKGAAKPTDPIYKTGLRKCNALEAANSAFATKYGSDKATRCAEAWRRMTDVEYLRHADWLRC